VFRRHRTHGQPALSRAVATLATAGVVVTGAVAAQAVAAPAYAGSSSLASAGSTFLRSIDAARAAHGARTLHLRADLTAVATRQAQRMAASNTLYHNPRLGSAIRGWLELGENVGEGGGARAIAHAFLRSPMHRANILDRGFSDVGIGVARGHGSLWVVEDFRRPTATMRAAERRHHRTTHTVQSAPVTVKAHRLPTLRLGSRGRLVAWVQGRLHVRADGIFGQITRHAVIRFKRAHGLRPDGIVGFRMWHALGR
jgi:uncharacterized protein YkwD